MPSTLRDRLIGSWKLVSFVEIDLSTGARRHPLGEAAEGLILYTPDGYMSAQLCTIGRPAFATGNPYFGEATEYAEAARSYLAYSGAFFVDEERGTLQHEMWVSLFPNWRGQRQSRVVTVNGESLTLATEDRAAGAPPRAAELHWRRAPANAPMPG